MATERPYEGVWRHTSWKKYAIDISHGGRRHNFSAFTDAKLSRRCREQILQQLERHDAGEPVDTRGLSARAIEILVALHVLDEQRRADLDGLRDQYLEHLQGKNDSVGYIKQTRSRLKKVLTGCKIKRPADISAKKVEAYLAGLRDGEDDLSITTSNHYLGAIKGFTGWLVRFGVLPADPLASLSDLNADTDIRLQRRPLTDPEFERLLANTEGMNKLPAESRRFLYQLARHTGLRAGELGSLTVDSFELDGPVPVAVVAATISKRRKVDRQPIPAVMLPQVRSFLAGRTGVLFPGKWWKRAAEMLQVDLMAAKIPYTDSQGRQADFHALRHGYVTGLARAGVKPAFLQKLARHSTIKLTLDVYTHLEEEEVAAALEGAYAPSMRPSMRPNLTVTHEDAQGSTDGDQTRKAG